MFLPSQRGTQVPGEMPSAFFGGVRPAENSLGTVRFVGSTQFADGEWFGIELEKPLGKNEPWSKFAS